MKTQVDIDFNQLKEQYGVELANEIKNDLEFALENNYAWKFEVLDERKYFTTLVFIHNFTTCVYEVSNCRKTINEKFIISRFDCERILELMNSVE